MSRPARAAAATTLVGGGALAWLALRRHDRRMIDADPEHRLLRDPPRGEPVKVRSADGTTLHAEVFGPATAPTIVLAHGWACSRRVWAYQVRDLADEFRLVAFDQRGHARSEEARGGGYGFRALAADLAAVVDHCVPAGEPVVVVGHSMGAMGLVAWVEEHPGQAASRLAGAVLANTCLSRLAREAEIVLSAAALGGLKEVIGRLLLGAPLRLPAGPTPAIYRGVRYVAMSRQATPAQVAFCERMFIDCPSDVRAALGLTLTRLDQQEALERLKAPTLVIVGGRDKVTPPSQGRRIAEALADAELVEIPGAGHVTPVEAHEEVTARIRALARRVLG